ncbi:MAG: TIM barrel protein [Verrucomicrobiota bacterium]
MPDRSIAGPRPALVAMENVFHPSRMVAWPDRCRIVAEEGYDGIYAVPYPLTPDDFERMRQLDREPARHGLKVAAVYANLDLALDDDSPFARLLRQLFEEMEGAPRIELSIKCSDPSKMPEQVEHETIRRLEPLLSIADRRGIDLAIYHHSFYPIEHPEQARAIVKKLKHPRLSCLFATSHAFALAEASAVKQQLMNFLDEIRSFNLCGCRRLDDFIPTKCHHLPLDQGELPTIGLLQLVRDRNYRGDLILQGGGWMGNPGTFLQSSMQVFDEVFG